MEMLSAFVGRVALPRGSGAKIHRPHQQGARVPSVSVVVPCYNYGHYLSGCVESVLSQSDVAVDVIVVDDASSDESLSIANSYASRDARVRVIGHATNQGHIATYNDGLDHVTGDYAVLLSADDLLTPGSLARATALMEAHPSVGLTYGFPVDFTDSHRPSPRTEPRTWIIWPGHRWISHACNAARNVVHSPEATIRTSVLRQIGGYRADLPHSGDLEMWLRAASVSDVGYIVGADQAYYRLHTANMHRSFDLLADVSHRLRTFDIFFDESSKLLPAADTMRKAAHKALAREALQHAISAYANGAASDQPIEGFAGLALSAWPDAKRMREWRALSRLRDMAGSELRRDPWLRMRETARNLRYSIGWWRRRWAGVD